MGRAPFLRHLICRLRDGSAVRNVASRPREHGVDKGGVERTGEYMSRRSLSHRSKARVPIVPTFSKLTRREAERHGDSRPARADRRVGSCCVPPGAFVCAVQQALYMWRKKRAYELVSAKIAVCHLRCACRTGCRPRIYARSRCVPRLSRQPCGSTRWRWA